MKSKAAGRATLALMLLLPAGASTAAQFAITGNNSAKLTFGGIFDGTNYLVVFQGNGMFNRANTNQQVAAQLVSQSGALVGPLIDLGRNCTTAISGQIPRVAFDGSNYLVAWTDSGNTGYDVYGQFVSPFGALVGAAFPISAQNWYQHVSGLTFDGSNYLVVWEDGRRGNNLFDVYGQLISKSGTLVGGQIQISPADGENYGNIRIATHENGRLVPGDTNYFVVFTSGAGSSTLVGQFVSPSGVRVGSAIIIKSDNVPISTPNIAGIGFDGSNYLVGWHQDVSSTEHDLLVRRVGRDGSLLGGAVAITTAPTLASLPFLVFDGANYLAVWSDSFGTLNQSLRARFVDTKGNSVGPEFAPLAPQGNNPAILGGAIFDGKQFMIVGILGSLNNGDLYGTFATASTTAPRLDPGLLVNGQFPVTLTGTPGINYTIQTSTNLNLHEWMVLGTSSPTNGPFTLTDLAATNLSRFYRALKQ